MSEAMPMQKETQLPIEQMPNLRLFYRKRGRAKYISHLDITRCMQRSLKRAGLPVWYTQGFNPHMYMTFALPLALGYESDYECMDLRFTHLMDFEEIQSRLNTALPRDIQVWKVDFQKEKPLAITQADYRLTVYPQDPERFWQEFSAFCEQPEILTQKRTKKGMKTVDLKPEFTLLGHQTEGERCILTLRTTAGQKNFNPTLLTDAFWAASGQTGYVQVLRTAVYAGEKLFE